MLLYTCQPDFEIVVAPNFLANFSAELAVGMKNVNKVPTSPSLSNIWRNSISLFVDMIDFKKVLFSCNLFLMYRHLDAEVNVLDRELQMLVYIVPHHQ